MGKLTVIAVAALLVSGVGMISGWGNQNVIFVCIAAVVLVVIVAFREIRQTLVNHPELALYDGSELLAYRRLEMATKDLPVLPSAPPISDPSVPRRPPALQPNHPLIFPSTTASGTSHGFSTIPIFSISYVS